MSERDERSLGSLLHQVVPGSALREGLERILGAHLGALIVLDDGRRVLEIASGGFHIDVEMTPQRLSELAKMDGAIVLKADASRIAWANVHLLPEPSTPTQETGTRHRTAERVARSLDVPVVAVSEETETITVYYGTDHRQLEPTAALFARANHLLQILERLKARLDEVSRALGAAEGAGQVTARKVATLLQRSAMVVRVANELDDLIDELGSHGRLLRPQLDELVEGIDEELRLVIADYLGPAAERLGAKALDRLELLSTDELLDLNDVLAAVNPSEDAEDLDTVLTPRGLRLLHQLSELPDERVDRLVEHFGDLRRLLRASDAHLAEVAEIDEEQARAIRRVLDPRGLPEASGGGASAG